MKISFFFSEKGGVRIRKPMVHYSNPQHNSLSMHINMHYTPTTIHPHCLAQPSYAHN